MNEVLLDPAGIGVALERMAREIIERKGEHLASLSARAASLDNLVLVGIRRGGEPFAKRIAEHARALAPKRGATGATQIAVGVVDITLYRDDAATALPNPRIGPSRIPVSIDGRRVVLVDDVLHTGRTIRAAIDALFDFGRPRVIELAVLIDRGGRELPIQPDYVGLRVNVGNDRRVEVMEKQKGPSDSDREYWALTVASRGNEKADAT